jgi:hypothetical protein
VREPRQRGATHLRTSCHTRHIRCARLRCCSPACVRACIRVCVSSPVAAGYLRRRSAQWGCVARVGACHRVPCCVRAACVVRVWCVCCSSCFDGVALRVECSWCAPVCLAGSSCGPRCGPVSMHVTETAHVQTSAHRREHTQIDLMYTHILFHRSAWRHDDAFSSLCVVGGAKPFGRRQRAPPVRLACALRLWAGISSLACWRRLLVGRMSSTDADARAKKYC